jgi:hypothetical protein
MSAWSENIALPERQGSRLRLPSAAMLQTSIGAGQMAQQPSSTTSSEAVCEGQARLREDSPQSSPAVPELSPIAPQTASRIADVATPRMAPGIGGFNIDPPPSRASPFEGDLAIEDIRRVGADLFPITPQAAPGIADVATPRMHVAIERLRRRSLPKPKLIPLPPIQAERKTTIVRNNESSFVFYLLAIIAMPSCYWHFPMWHVFR